MRELIDPEYVIAEARRRTGLLNWGATESLHKALRILTSTQELNFDGICVYSEFLIQTISNRLRVVHFLERHPAYSQRQIKNPLFIVGLPRSGTTFLHKLLTQAEDTQYIPHWETSCMGLEIPRPHDMIQTARKKISRVYASHPKLKTMRHVDAEDPEECMHLMLNTLMEPIGFYLAGSDLNYVRFCYSHDKTDAYEFYRNQLKLLKSYRPDKRWVLKSHSHCISLATLYCLFPDAMFVTIHRDINEVIASSISVAKEHRKLICDNTDIENDIIKIIALLGFRYTQQYPYLPGHRIYHLQYTALINDPLKMVRYIHSYFDLDWSQSLEEKIGYCIEHNPPNKYGIHEY